MSVYIHIYMYRYANIITIIIVLYRVFLICSVGFIHRKSYIERIIFLQRWVFNLESYTHRQCYTTEMHFVINLNFCYTVIHGLGVIVWFNHQVSPVTLIIFIKSLSSRNFPNILRFLGLPRCDILYFLVYQKKNIVSGLYLCQLHGIHLSFKKQPSFKDIPVKMV